MFITTCTHHFIVSGGHGGDIGQPLIGDLSGEVFELLDERSHGGLDSAGELDGAGAGGDDLHSLGDDCGREDGGGRRAVASGVVRLGGRLRRGKYCATTQSKVRQRGRGVTERVSANMFCRVFGDQRS